MQRTREQQAAVIFKRAANYIRAHGWQVSGMSQDGKPRCSMGALASAHKADRWDKNLARLMYDKLYQELGGMSLTEFNEKFRSGEKVARLFERTANHLGHQS